MVQMIFDSLRYLVYKWVFLFHDVLMAFYDMSFESSFPLLTKIAGEEVGMGMQNRLQ